MWTAALQMSSGVIFFVFVYFFVRELAYIHTHTVKNRSLSLLPFSETHRIYEFIELLLLLRMSSRYAYITFIIIYYLYCMQKRKSLFPFSILCRSVYTLMLLRSTIFSVKREREREILVVRGPANCSKMHNNICLSFSPVVHSFLFVCFIFCFITRCTYAFACICSKCSKISVFPSSFSYIFCFLFLVLLMADCCSVLHLQLMHFILFFFFGRKMWTLVSVCLLVVCYRATGTAVTFGHHRACFTNQQYWPACSRKTVLANNKTCSNAAYITMSGCYYRCFALSTYTQHTHTHQQYRSMHTVAVVFWSILHMHHIFAKFDDMQWPSCSTIFFFSSCLLHMKCAEWMDLGR